MVQKKPSEQGPHSRGPKWEKPVNFGNEKSFGRNWTGLSPPKESPAALKMIKRWKIGVEVVFPIMKESPRAEAEDIVRVTGLPLELVKSIMKSFTEREKIRKIVNDFDQKKKK